MNKRLKMLFVVLIFLSMLLPMIGEFLNIDFSSKNSLTSISPPEIVIDNKFNTKFPVQFDDYYSQSFPFRSLFVSAYHKLSLSIFDETGNDKVIAGKNGMLYFDETLQDYQRSDVLMSKDIERLNEIFRIMSEYSLIYDTELFLMIAPNKASIYPEFMPTKFTVFNEKSNLEMIENAIDSVSMIDVKSVIINAKDVYNEQLYHDLDSHWNNLGAYLAYVEMSKQMDKEYLEMDLFDITIENNHKGDLTTMLYPAIDVYDEQYNLNLPETFTFTRPIRQLDDLQIESINSEGSESLIMFRDSFANALIPYLSQSYQNVFYARNFPYDFTSLIENPAPNLVIEIAERNIPWLLQATPILKSVVNQRTTIANNQISLNVTLTTSKQSNQTFINASFDNQKTASNITAIKLVNDDVELDAFPIYQDDDYQDNTIIYGFSAYVDLSVDVDSLDVLVLMDDTWYQITK